MSWTDLNEIITILEKSIRFWARSRFRYDLKINPDFRSDFGFWTGKNLK